MSSPRESDLRTAEAATWSAKKGASFTRAAENPALYGRLYAAHCQALGLVLPERRQRGHRRPPRWRRGPGRLSGGEPPPDIAHLPRHC